MYKVSVIIPVYNKEKYIAVCLRSIMIQTYTNLEIIAVDDGSSDASFSICQEYAIKDNRIRLIRQANGGPSEARNSGINAATGEYIIFIDADDYVAPDYIEHLMEYAGFDLVISGYFELRGRIQEKYVPILTKVQDSDKFADIIFNANNFRFITGPCLKLYKTQLVKKNNVRFIDITFGEDTAFVFHYLRFCKSITFINYAGYFNRILQGTLSRKKVNGIWQMLQQVIDIGEDTFHYKFNRYWQYIQLRMIKICLTNDLSSYAPFKCACINVITSTDFIHLNFRHCETFSDKVLCFCLKCNLFKMLYLLCKIKQRGRLHAKNIDFAQR